MIRTTLTLPENLHQRLVITSRQEGKNFSEAVRDLLSLAYTIQRKGQVKRIFQGLRELDGIGDAAITNASTTIDEVLYGERGAWRGGGK
jgi:hypothetical protein